MKRIYLLAIGLVLLTVIAVWFCYPKGNKIAWIEINKVYDGFEYKKEMDKKYMKTEAARKKIIDSLELDLKLVFNRMQLDQQNKELVALFETKRSYFLNRKQELDEDSETTRATYYEQILNQINQYVRDFGKEKGYSVILGANGNGSVMYAEDKIDITKEVIGYINNKYKGL